MKKFILIGGLLLAAALHGMESPDEELPEEQPVVVAVQQSSSTKKYIVYGFLVGLAVMYIGFKVIVMKDTDVFNAEALAAQWAKEWVALASK
jgi:hypothetical protein